MPVFELQTEDGKKFQVDAPDAQTAASSLKAHSGQPVTDTTNAFTGGAIEGIPIAGPFIKGGIEKGAAGVRSLMYGTPYQDELKAVQDYAATTKKEHPVAETAGEIAGGIGSLGALGATATGAKLLGMTGSSLPGMMGRSALSGGVIGAADAAARGENPITGGVIGAGTGGVAPAIGRGISMVAEPAVNAIRGMRDPAAEATRRVAGAIDRDIASGSYGLSPAEFSGARAEGKPVNLMDIGGETTRALARSAANTSPQGRGELNRVINDRFESQSDRVIGWFNNTFGPADRGATREALELSARQANKPAYAKAYSEGSKPIWSDELQRLVGSPDVVDAMKHAAEKGKSRAIADGFGGFNSSVKVNPSGVVEFTKGKNGVPTYPDLQFWDYTKRALDDGAKKAARAGADDEAAVLKNLASKLRGELDTIVPSYQDARAGAAKFFGAHDAVDAGEKFLTSNMPMPDARRAFAAMSDPERELFRQSFVQSLVSKVEAAPDRRNVVNMIAQSRRAQEQIVMTLGPQRARELEATLRIEGVMQLAKDAVQGGPTTARQLAELGLAGGVNFYEGGGSFTTDPAALTKAALVYGAARGHRVVDERVAQHVARLLASSDQAELTRGIRMIARNSTMLNSIRNADAALAAVSARGAARPVSEKLGVQ